MTARADGGFTLLEMLVAITVLGFLIAGLSQGVQFELRAWDTHRRALSAHNELDAVDLALRRLVMQMDPGDAVELPRVSGGPAKLAFVTELPVAAERLVTTRADVALLVNQAHQFVIAWTPSLHVERFGVAPPPRTTELLRDVDRVVFAYLQPVAAGGRWQSTWNLPYLPALVRIHIVFPPGDPRHWPDIVAAPMLERLGQ